MLKHTLCEVALDHGIETLVSNYEPHLKRLYERAGAELEELGRATGFGRFPVCCGIFEVSARILRQMRTKLEVSEPLYRRSHPTRRQTGQPTVRGEKLAFSQACAGIVGLLDDGHGDLLSLIKGQAVSQELRGVRREIWNFVKNPATGLPASNLDAVKEWHPQLVVRVKALLGRLEKQYGFVSGDNLGNRLKKTALPNGPLVEAPEGDEPQNLQFRLSTVHKVKGESLDGVMYVASRSNIEEFLAGTKTENGKIGYVALTRARNVFVLAVPSDAIAALKPLLDATGFQDGDVCALAGA